MDEPVLLSKGIAGAECAIAKTLDMISNKWTFLIVRDLLLDGTVRFGELLRSLDGISAKTLTMRLRELEEKGIVIRHVYPEVPPRVEYSLTDKGKKLEPLFIELKRFGLSL